MTYESFRIQISPNVAQPGAWSVEVLKCPVAGLVGASGTVQPVFTRAELTDLRNPALWPNQARLQTIGENVWRSLMPERVRDAYLASLALVEELNKGLRVVVVINGNDANGNSGQVRLSELPVEAVFADRFIARELKTPVSRSLAVSSNYDPLKTLLPLRILVVVAAPIDMPQASIDKEKELVVKALQPLMDTNTVKVEFCLGASIKKLRQTLARDYHIVHFICHGAFEPAGEDATSVPYLCLESEDTHESDPLAADNLRPALLASGTRLVIFTSCASSAPAPNQEPYEHRAFDGMAQSLVGGGIPAVVAMQFDFESTAAVTFSETFYQWFLRDDVSLDLAVTKAREAVAMSSGAGHRAWVTPTVYWNCAGVPLFDFARLRADLDPQTRQEIKEIEAKIEMGRKLIAMMPTTAAEKAALAQMRTTFLEEIRQLEEERGLKLGDSLRLWDGPAVRGGTVDLRLELRLRLAATIGLTKFKVHFPLDQLTFAEALQGAGMQDAPAVIPAAGELTIVFADVSQGHVWAPGRYELGTLRFHVDGNAKDTIDLKLRDATVTRNGAVTPFVTLEPVVFVQ